MITALPRLPARDAALLSALPHISQVGWGYQALKAAGQPGSMVFFPAGAADMVEAWCDLTDRQMTAAADDIMGLRISARVRALVALRLEQARLHKDVVRRAFAWFAIPGHGRVAARCVARTVDAMWYIAGDQAADFSWYTKRASLAAIYGATLLFWLQDDSGDDAGTLDFLDRRLANIGQISRLRRRRPGASFLGRLKGNHLS